jgi:tetratricopeptide (TPR) repeat protein
MAAFYDRYALFSSARPNRRLNPKAVPPIIGKETENLRGKMTDALQLWQSHRYEEAIDECEKELAVRPNDIAAASVLAGALFSKGDYDRALPFLERVDAHERLSDVSIRVTPGHPGRRMDISCAHWLLGDRARGIALMHKFVEDSLRGRITYGDAAGGVTQGLILFYMGASVDDSASQSLSLTYLRNRAKRRAINLWPGPVARYYLDEVRLQDMLADAAGHPDVPNAVAAAGTHLLKRRQLCQALFHDAARKRAEGREAECLERMRQCHDLEDPLIELEWYLARGEVENGTDRLDAKSS